MSDLKTEYIRASVRGAAFLPWQAREPVSDIEHEFRQRMEARKDVLLAGRIAVRHPVMLNEAQLETARRNIETTWWGAAWFEKTRAACDVFLTAPSDYYERMIPDTTPAGAYGFTCPNCVGIRSQEGMGVSMFAWSPYLPETITCKVCGQTLPDARYPETGVLACPRRGQAFRYYLNENERNNPEERDGRHAWRWVGHPMHISFSGIARLACLNYTINAASNLGLLYQLSGKTDYAVAAARILRRLTKTISNYLYHDYWDTIADCDPLYAAWHDRTLPLEWKRHPVESAFGKDTLEQAGMLQSYWGAGRIRACDGYLLESFCMAYDMTAEARSEDGEPVWSNAWRARIERDLLLEHAFGAEPFVGGAGKAENVSNKAPYVYLPFASMGLTLGLPEYVHVALLGYEALRDQSFLYDGFSRESPAYTAMYLRNALLIPEYLEGYRWPDSFGKRRGSVNLFRDDRKLRLMLRAQRDSLRGTGKYFPLSDTLVVGAPAPLIFEIGLKRDPQAFSGLLPSVYRAQNNVMGDGISPPAAPPEESRPACDLRPSEYALFNLQEKELAVDRAEFSDILFPAWRTAILRHGKEPRAAEAALSFNPRGGHRHADQLSLFYADCGHIILGDLGYVGDSAMLAWGGSTESHNVVLVDDQNQIEPSKREERDGPDLRLMVSTPRISVVEAEARAYRQCSRYRRLVALIKAPGGQSLLIDIFRVSGGEKHAYRIFSELAAGDNVTGALEFDGLTLPPEKPLPDYNGSIAREHVYGLRDQRKTDAPAANWRAVWRQADRAYRLHIMSPADTVQAAHGPGQETLTQVGRRLRFVDVIRRGARNLSSTFVALHEPGGATGKFAVRAAQRIAVPDTAGPDAVAIRLETEWGIYLIFNEFKNTTEVDGIQCRGTFGVLHQGGAGAAWRLTCGETYWHGEIADQTENSLTADKPRPADWPLPPEDATIWMCAEGGDGTTGFAVRNVSDKQIDFARFPLPPLKRFRLPSVRIREDLQT